MEGFGRVVEQSEIYNTTPGIAMSKGQVVTSSEANHGHHGSGIAPNLNDNDSYLDHHDRTCCLDYCHDSHLQ